MDYDMGSENGGGKKHSYSIGSTVWLTEGVWHFFKKRRDELKNILGISNNIILFRACSIGMDVWSMAIKAGIEDYEEVKAVIAREIEKYSFERNTTKADEVSDTLYTQALVNINKVRELKARDEALIEILENMGFEKFKAWIKESDPNFNLKAWITRVEAGYEPTWKHKARILLIAYFSKHGDVPGEQVKEWAKKVGLLGGEQGTTLGTFAKFASSEGFTGQPKPRGMWGLPENSLVENHIDIDLYDGSQTIITLYHKTGVEENILV